MKLTPEQIKSLATLSRLREEDVEHLSADLASILEYVEQVQGVDVSGVVGVARVGEETGVTREDAVTNPATPERRSELIGEAGEIRVPGVFEDLDDA